MNMDMDMDMDILLGLIWSYSITSKPIKQQATKPYQLQTNSSVFEMRSKSPQSKSPPCLRSSNDIIICVYLCLSVFISNDKITLILYIFSNFISFFHII